MKSLRRTEGRALAGLVVAAAGRSLPFQAAPCIIARTGRALAVAPVAIVGPDRHKNVSDARHIAMFLVRATLELSYPDIGRLFGGRDHTTVMSAIEKISGGLAAGETRFVQMVRAVVLSDDSAASGGGL